MSKEKIAHEFGARPLKRMSQKYMQDPLALSILKGEFKQCDTIKIELGRDELEFSVCF